MEQMHPEFRLLEMHRVIFYLRLYTSMVSQVTRIRIRSYEDEGLQLYNCRITNAVKCLPPQNKPTSKEAQTCAKNFLKKELAELPSGSVILTLGSLAHNEVLRSFGRILSNAKFGHNVCLVMDNGLYLLNSYHCSRYNTQTKRLTQDMFDEVFNSVESLLLKSV